MSWTDDLLSARPAGDDDRSQPLVFRWQQAAARSRLSADLLAVAFALSTYGNGDGTMIYASAERIALGTGKDPSTIRRYRDQLVTLGWFALDERGGQRGGRRNSRYHLVIPENAVTKDEVDLLLKELNARRLEWKSLPPSITPAGRPHAPRSNGSTPCTTHDDPMHVDARPHASAASTPRMSDPDPVHQGTRDQYDQADHAEQARPQPAAGVGGDDDDELAATGRRFLEERSVHPEPRMDGRTAPAAADPMLDENDAREDDAMALVLSREPQFEELG